MTKKCDYCFEVFTTWLELDEHKEKEHPIEYSLELQEYELQIQENKFSFLGKILWSLLFIVGIIAICLLSILVNVFFLLFYIPLPLIIICLFGEMIYYHKKTKVKELLGHLSSPLTKSIKYVNVTREDGGS